MKVSVNYEQMKDCFLYDKDKKECKGLHYMYCEEDGRCSFWRPKEKKCSKGAQ